MGHVKWFLIDNKGCQNFKEKIQKTKEACLDVLGKSAGTHFHKKLLLQKDPKADSSVLPINFGDMDQSCFEEIHLSETFIDYQTAEGEVLSCSVEKKGAKNSYTYTLKVQIKKKNQ